MRYALFSDIHGNMAGLQAVFTAIDHLGGVDRILALGDIFGVGPGSGDLLDLLLERRVEMVRGNWEEVLLWPDEAIKKVPEKYRTFVCETLDRVRQDLSTDQLDLLRRLPLSLTLEPAPGHRAMVCHATPVDSWELTCQADLPLAVLRKAYGSLPAEVILYGHMHQHHVLPLDGKLLVNVAAVGGKREPQEERRGLFSDFTLLEYYDHWAVTQYQAEYSE